MFFPTTVSDNAVKKAFLEFGEVHDVFDGKFKKPYNDISNDKCHIRITPYKTKHDFSHEIFFDDSYLFRVMWAEKVSYKKCVCTHAVILATQLQITLQMRTVSLIIRILHWLL